MSMIVLAFGTRPEAIKLGPVAACLRDLDVEFRVVCSGQHHELLRGTPAENDLWPADGLGLKSSGNVLRWVEKAITPFRKAFRDADASLVCVQGDTMTALAAARAAHQAKLPIAHIEAGVRSGNLEEPWPEEGFRREITQLATYHYAPTSQAYANLLTEGVSHTRIRITGNTVVSALHRYAPYFSGPPENQILVTMHRREWVEHCDVPAFADALSEVASDYPTHVIVWPVHPGVSPKLIGKTWAQNLQMVTPMPYKTTIRFLAMSLGVITDSGGLVEEAATIGIPTVIMRKYNDRPEAVEAGIAKRLDPTPENVQAAVRMLIAEELPRRRTTVYGEWGAAGHIANHLQNASLSSIMHDKTPAGGPLSAG